MTTELHQQERSELAPNVKRTSFYDKLFTFFSQLIVSKILQECDRLSGETFLDRKILSDSRVVLPFTKDGLRYQFDFTIENFVASKSPIAPIASVSSLEDLQLPDIYPMKCNISVPVSNLYKRELVYRK